MGSDGLRGLSGLPALMVQHLMLGSEEMTRYESRSRQCHLSNLLNKAVVQG